MNSKLLENYYRNFFPCNDLCRWLNLGIDLKIDDSTTRKSYFERREFVFYYHGDIYCRHISFSSADELKEQLIHDKPEKFGIGAVYSLPPKLRNRKQKKIKYEPVEREFVIDIDMSDYDKVRTCCSGAVVCQLCWKFLELAWKTIDNILKELFGFKVNLWVFSGRRGIHCWVCDSEARRLSDFERKSLIEFLNSGPNFSIYILNICRAIFNNRFEEIIVKDQKLFENQERLDECVKIINSQLGTTLKFAAKGTSEETWAEILDFINSQLDQQKIDEIKNKIYFSYLYPRLDIYVSMEISNLLKSPFSVHPKTGNISIPFLVELAEEFRVDKVPNLVGLNAGVDDLAPHIKVLNIISDKLKECCRKKRNRKTANFDTQNYVPKL
ncbi:unnamed protein product [Blepharisma stoltei]|uniref:DNA primase n=1 Tax=Blepharisma stoltei TaxID=1481888 RepID=A0AAU9JTB7_9CILI|nr:unnamed protein product [Blepharisma stoltei]